MLSKASALTKNISEAYPIVYLYCYTGIQASVHLIEVGCPYYRNVYNTSYGTLLIDVQLCVI